MTASRLSFILAGLLCLSAALSYITGLDSTLAFMTYNPNSALAWLKRDWGTLPPLIISISFLLFLIIPPLRDKFPNLRHVAAIWVLVAIVGTGLVNQVILKDLIGRPRPREDVLVALHTPDQIIIPAKASLTGSSMPSGHAGAAFLFLMPAFPLWRQKRYKLAAAFFVFGALYGTTISFSRMALGAHYLSDVLIAAAINIGMAGIFTRFISSNMRIRTRYPLSFFLIASTVVIITKDVRTTLTWQGTLTQKPSFNLPCTVTIPPAVTFPSNAQITVQLRGKGYPDTWIYLQEANNTLSLKRFGIHHQLICAATFRNIQ